MTEKNLLIDSQTPIKWEAVDVTPQLRDGKTTIPAETIESIKRNKVALKGPLAVRKSFKFEKINL